MPTSRKVKKALFTLLPPVQGKIYELGSGWGHLIFPLASRFPKASIHAYEGSPLPWLVSKGVQKVVRKPNLTLHRKDFFDVSLQDANLVVCYLFPGAMSRLKEKFERELKPGALIVSNTFAIPGWEPEKVIQADDLWKSNVYLYRA